MVLCASDFEDATRGKLACKVSFSKIVRDSKIIETSSRNTGSTQRIRSMLKICIRGYRTLRALASKKLAPLTSLVGADFVKAWLEVVRFHAFLWSRDFEYGDPSLWNVMYNEGRTCGVLGDYDLVICRQKLRVPGTDKTGTIPFMAVDLLNDEYWHGDIAKRLYRHEFEAFIWVLPFVFLRYKNGKSQPGTDVDSWMTSNYVACRKEKNDFRDPDKQEVLWWSEWLNVINFAPFRRVQGMGVASEDYSSMASIWPAFIAQLRLAARASPSRIGYLDILIDNLNFEKPFWVRHHS